jgi:hypothetical protein
MRQILIWRLFCALLSLATVIVPAAVESAAKQAQGVQTIFVFDSSGHRLGPVHTLSLSNIVEVIAVLKFDSVVFGIKVFPDRILGVGGLVFYELSGCTGRAFIRPSTTPLAFSAAVPFQQVVYTQAKSATPADTPYLSFVDDRPIRARAVRGNRPGGMPGEIARRLLWSLWLKQGSRLSPTADVAKVQ